MTIGIRRFGALAVAATMAIAACSSSATPPSAASSAPGSAAAGAGGTFAPTSCATGSITAAGSTALQPLVTAAGQIYTAACPGSTITVNGGGSGTGLTQIASGAIDIGDSDVTAASKLATPDAAGLVDHLVAKQGWIVVANKDVTGVTNLTTAQNVAIWTGVDTNWSQVGGPNLPIVLILRPTSSGTRATFKQIVLGGAAEANGQALTEDSNGAVTTAVQATNGSISVIGFAYYQTAKDNLVGFQLDGVDATVANMTSNTYKLNAVGHMYTKGDPTGLTKSFLDYMLSPVVQQGLIPSQFYAPASQ
ncbi:MAG TPA: phosphate ABC transporter substrate-binding protein [Candidatus Limnocylindrales bacterium]|nr:phosphate ABC transporter substrate-binding protein [Candidatus Limnocylindrales bacterium]